MFLKEFDDSSPFITTKTIGWKQQQKIVEYIHKNCQEILMTYQQTNDCLYRGLSHDAGPIMIGKSNENREPVDTPKEIQNKVDSLLQGAGFKALRRNSIFCTSDIDRAEFFTKRHFTQIYVIFPLDGFEYTWSSKIDDFSEYFGLVKADSGNHPDQMDVVSSFDNLDSIGFVEKYDYHNTNLSEAVLRQKEVMLRGGYVLVKRFGYKELLDQILGK